MKRSGNMTTAAPQVILLVLASCACVWAAQMSDNYEKMRLLYNYPSGFKRLPSYDFGLGKRSFGESDLASASSSSYEEQLSPLDALLEQQQQQQQGGGQQLAYVYPNAFGKRTRAYGFGLGKRLTQNENWKLGGSSFAAPTYRFALFAFFSLVDYLPSSPSSYLATTAFTSELRHMSCH